MAYENSADKRETKKEQGEGSAKKHDVTVLSRRNVTLDGLEDIVSFDENCVVLRTVMGLLTVDGEDMRIVNMDVGSGELSVSGRICALFYEDGTTKKKGLFGKK